MLSFIDAVGVDNTIIRSDLGQKDDPWPIDSYERVLGQRLDAGVSREDIRKLVAANTGRVLDRQPGAPAAARKAQTTTAGSSRRRRLRSSS